MAIASAVLLLKAAQGKMWRYLDGEENVGAEENEDRDVVDTACDSDGYDSGVDNASDFDSDVEERQVESLISKYS